MSFVKRDVKDRAVEHPRRYQLVEVEPGIYDLIPVTGTVTEAGTAINKAYLQPIEDNLEAALEKTGDGKNVIVTFTEAAVEAHIASGESLATMFGKILKKFKSIVPISLGGTGGSTAAAARNNLGLGNTAGALPVANGGTGNTTAANARTALGVPPTAHASTGTDYGVGNASNYGHVKVRNDLVGTETSGATVSPAQIKVLNERVIKDKPVLLATISVPSDTAQSVDIQNYLNNAYNPYDEYIFELSGAVTINNTDSSRTKTMGLGLYDTTQNSAQSTANSMLFFYLEPLMNITVTLPNNYRIIYTNAKYMSYNLGGAANFYTYISAFNQSICGFRNSVIPTNMSPTRYLRFAVGEATGTYTITNNTLKVKIYGVRYNTIA